MKTTTLAGALFAGASTLVLCVGMAFGATPTFPACTNQQSGQTVTFVVNTDGNSGWTTAQNGPAVALSNSAGLWAAATAPVSWIGPVAGTDQWSTSGSNNAAGQYTYDVRVNLAGPSSKHPNLTSVTAQWMADNCGLSMKAGSGQWVDTDGAQGVNCFENPSPNGKDFRAPHSTTANFGTGNGSGQNVHIKFRLANQPNTPTGFAAALTLTGTCP
jgi:hypothetical protein